MRYANPRIQETAQRIPVLCGLFFVIFCALFLYFYQGCNLAQTQHLLSQGTTTYRPLIAAGLSSFILLILGVALSLALRRMPLRLKCVSWFPSFVLLGIFTQRHFVQFGEAESPDKWWLYLLLLVIFLLLVYAGNLFPDSSKEHKSSSAYVWPNLMQLVLYSVVCVSISNQNPTIHRTLRANQAIGLQQYDRALELLGQEESPSRSNSAMVAYTLSRKGKLADSLFCYPQHYGSEGLFPLLKDTLMVVNLPLTIGRHLGYMKGDHLKATRFLEQVRLLDTKESPQVKDYMLCAYLLDRDVPRFVDAMGIDSLVQDLPHHYSEALALYESMSGDSVNNCSVELMRKPLHRFLRKRKRGSKLDEFATTYWYYYFGLNDDRRQSDLRR